MDIGQSSLSDNSNMSIKVNSCLACFILKETYSMMSILLWFVGYIQTHKIIFHAWIIGPSSATSYK